VLSNEPKMIILRYTNEDARMR